MFLKLYVETIDCERLKVLRTNGFHTGKPFDSFMTIAGTYCTRPNASEPEVIEWFSVFEDDAGNLCQSLQVLDKAYFGGDWDYGEDEYEFWCRRNPNMAMGEGAFRVAIQQVAKKWTPIAEIQRSVDSLLEILQRAKPRETFFFHPAETVKDIEAVANTISILAPRCPVDCKVRIRFYL